MGAEAWWATPATPSVSWWQQNSVSHKQQASGHCSGAEHRRKDRRELGSWLQTQICRRKPHSAVHKALTLERWNARHQGPQASPKNLEKESKLCTPDFFC